MFFHPTLKAGESFPPLPCDDVRWQELMTALDVRIDTSPGKDDALTQYTRYGVGWVERLPSYVRPEHAERVSTSHLGPLLRRAGLVDRIDPTQPEQDYALVDGGSMGRYDVRLNHLETLQQERLLSTPRVVVFGGQSLRSSSDSLEALEVRGRKLLGNTDNWGQTWLENELGKSDSSSDPWQRPFATERELGMLCLFGIYSKRLHHFRSRQQPDAVSIHPSIPPAAIASDDFYLGNQIVTVLNAPARIREHAGRKLPISEARPNGRSCFAEWLRLHDPPEGSSVILVTHAPNIYRSWLDLVLRAAEAGRQDLRITAAGAALEEDKTVGDVLEGLGNLIINHYNHDVEGGIDIPPSTPFRMEPPPHPI
jgi:hypothetical protein